MYACGTLAIYWNHGNVRVMEVARVKQSRRAASIESLREMDEGRALPRLVKALVDQDPEVRRAAASSLGSMRSPCRSSRLSVS